MENYDFSGWCTKANLKCSDGRTILKDAFKHDDGHTVPLVWNHNHNDPLNVLGHAALENRSEGVYAYCKFNATESGQAAKQLVEHGDVSQLSIYANQLKQQGSNVMHGKIREVSLVLAGANPGAFIDSVIKHGEESDEEAVIYTGEDIALSHADNSKPAKDTPPDAKEGDDETVEDVFNTLTETQKTAVYALVGHAVEHGDDSDAPKISEKIETSDGEKTVADVFNTLNEKQKTVVYALIGKALEENNDENDKKKGEDETMKHNVFDQDNNKNEKVLMHDAMQTIIADGKRYGSMKESFLAHAAEYGIENIDYLFPEAQTMNNPPAFIQRDMGWVTKVMNGVHKTPFSRIKSVFADITEDDARARGYMKGNLKKEEVFSLLKRTTTPTTIYKKQKLDRDDVIDITDFDVVTWLKAEMRMMLDEEIARAILIGDGRLASSDDKINETNVRPIYNDEELYTIQAEVKVAANATDDEKAKAMIRAAVKARKDYKGSGSTTFFTHEEVLTNALLLEDNQGHRLYKSAGELAEAMRVKEIITVPVMEGMKGKDGESDLLGVIVNLNDYNIGADKGGAVNMFDDFDIDYNQQKYLIETRCSGALIKPKAAIALVQKTIAG